MSCLIWIEWANKRRIGERRRHEDYKFLAAMTAQSTQVALTMPSIFILTNNQMINGNCVNIKKQQHIETFLMKDNETNL